MKVIIYCLISLTITLTIPLMLPLLASADTIYFKDGTIVHDIGRTWRAGGQVKWKMAGITIGYPEEDVERVEKTPIEEDSIGNQTISKKNINKGTKPPVQTISKSELQSKGVRIGDGLVLKGVSKTSQSVLVVVEADKKEIVKCEAYDSNDNLIGTSTSFVEPPLQKITIKTYDKTNLFKSLKCWSPKDKTHKVALQNPPYFGMEKWQYNLCIALGKKVMNAQRRKPDSPQHKAAYKDWDINCGILVMSQLSKKNTALSPLDWANLKSYRVPQPTRKTTIQKQSKRSINPNPIAKVPRSKAKSDIKGKLAQKYAGSYSLQKTLLGQHMKSYDYLISLPSDAVNSQILSKLMGRYYPHFSLIKTLYEQNIKAYRELQN